MYHYNSAKRMFKNDFFILIQWRFFFAVFKSIPSDFFVPCFHHPVIQHGCHTGGRSLQVDADQGHPGNRDDKVCVKDDSLTQYSVNEAHKCTVSCGFQTYLSPSPTSSRVIISLSLFISFSKSLYGACSSLLTTSSNFLRSTLDPSSLSLLAIEDINVFA